VSNGPKAVELGLEAVNTGGPEAPNTAPEAVDGGLDAVSNGPRAVEFGPDAVNIMHQRPQFWGRSLSDPSLLMAANAAARKHFWKQCIQLIRCMGQLSKR